MRGRYSLGKVENGREPLLWQAISVQVGIQLIQLTIRVQVGVVRYNVTIPYVKIFRFVWREFWRGFFTTKR